MIYIPGWITSGKHGRQRRREFRPRSMLKLLCSFFFLPSLFPFFPVLPTLIPQTIMTILTNFGAWFSSSKAKQASIASNVLKRSQQPFTSSSVRPHPQVRTEAQYQRQQYQQSGSDPELITEGSILNAFPRPNLTPTLHFSLFGLQNSPPSGNVEGRKRRCTNCAGPHSTEFCPC